jgi:hypothetical protein
MNIGVKEKILTHRGILVSSWSEIWLWIVQGHTKYEENSLQQCLAELVARAAEHQIDHFPWEDFFNSLDGPILNRF